MQELDRVADDGHHSLQRFDCAFGAARHTDDQGALAHAGHRARERGHGRAVRSGPPHGLADAGHLVVDDGRDRLGRDVAGAEPCAACGDHQVDASLDRGHDRLANPLGFIGNDLRVVDLEATLAQQAQECLAAGILALAMERTIADRDHMRLAHRGPPAAGRFHVPERPPDFSSRRTDSMDTPRSMPLVMSIRVSPATAAAVRASISTPVCPTTRARARTRTPPLTNSKSMSTLANGRGWQSGIRSEVRFAAMMPATRATWSASPFGVPSRTARNVGGAIRTTHSASASREVIGLPATSTMRAAPPASRCVSRFAAGFATRSGYSPVSTVEGVL